MNTNLSRAVGFCVAATLLGSAPALAQSFPTSDRWSPLHCTDSVMTDRFQDESGATSERDLVGDVDHPAGAIASDGEFLYLRVRVESDPVPGGEPRPFAWGILLDVDGTLTDYEVMVHANGIGNTVSLYKNSTTTVPNDPTDPPDEPAVKTYPFADYARSVRAEGTSFGGNDDYFLEFAIPWADLEPLGIGPSTPVVAWAATSSNSTSLNGDFACWDDAAGTPTLSGTAPDRTVLDPGVDSDGDGYTDRTELDQGTDPHDAASHPAGEPDALALAGGGGCQSVPAASGVLALVAFALAFVGRRHRAGA